MPLMYRCVCCRVHPADDEYHWYTDAGDKVVWKLCADCCEFACEMVELISNLESEVEEWIQNGLDN